MFHGLRIVSNTLDIDANIVGSIRDSELKNELLEFYYYV